MVDKQITTVVVHNEAVWDFMPGWPSDSKVVDFIAWLDGVINDIPTEYRKVAGIKIDSISGYEGEHHAEVMVSYERPETDEEMEARVARNERRNRDIETRERQDYARLRKKYK